MTTRLTGPQMDRLIRRLEGKANRLIADLEATPEHKSLDSDDVRRAGEALTLARHLRRQLTERDSI